MHPAQMEGAQRTELREGFTQDIGRVKDTESDSDSVASGHVSAYFAAARGKVKDEDDDDDDDSSVVTDDTSDQESTAQDDQSRSRSAARDVSRLTTYRGEQDMSSDDTKSPPTNVLSGGYKFNVGSNIHVFRKTHGHGRRATRQPLRSIQGTSQHRVPTQSNNQVSTTSTVNAAGQRAAYQVYCDICRKYVSEDLHPRCHDSTNNHNGSVNNTPTTRTAVTVSAPVMAQQSQ